nr:MFS transporter [Arthrobacter sp. JCM 19049]
MLDAINTATDDGFMPVSSSPAATRSAPAVQHGRGFWIVAFAFLTSMAFASAPAPLYVLYQQRSGFSSFTVTLIFATYALGVVVSLFLAGHISDRVGRRRILVPAVAWFSSPHSSSSFGRTCPVCSPRVSSRALGWAC